MKILVTGGSGFIGSTLIKALLKNKKNIVLNIDKISKYSVSESLIKINTNKYTFQKLDLKNYKKLEKVFNIFKPNIIYHLAAESHVDRSLISPKKFVENNFFSTLNLLECYRKYSLKYINKKKLFINISTDEVYGSLNNKQKPFNENSPFRPNSPYSSSKASSDLLVRSWNRSYNLSIITTHCSNNFGPWQFPEKLIPVVIYNLSNKKNIPVYGKGNNIRDWIYVEDHVKCLILISKKGKVGENYNIGGNKEISNLDLIKKIIKIFKKNIKSTYNYNNLITFVDDRLGHDFRYAISNHKINKNLNFKLNLNFENNLEKTVKWYIKNISWTNKRIKDIK